MTRLAFDVYENIDVVDCSVKAVVNVSMQYVRMSVHHVCDFTPVYEVYHLICFQLVK